MAKRTKIQLDADRVAYIKDNGSLSVSKTVGFGLRTYMDNMQDSYFHKDGESDITSGAKFGASANAYDEFSTNQVVTRVTDGASKVVISTSTEDVITQEVTDGVDTCASELSTTTIIYTKDASVILSADNDGIRYKEDTFDEGTLTADGTLTLNCLNKQKRTFFAYLDTSNVDITLAFSNMLQGTEATLIIKLGAGATTCTITGSSTVKFADDGTAPSNTLALTASRTTVIVAKKYYDFNSSGEKVLLTNNLYDI